LALLFFSNKIDSNTMQDKELIEKIKALPPDKIAEVVDFIDFLAHRDDRLLVEAAAKVSEPAFAAVWNNSEDAEYDKL
jgi:hypothetical protein